jgi:RNase adaptor protein for sRNA GlmZ degradation
MAKPALILVGADKGGVGKTTVARTLLDYFTAHHVPTRAFDTETPKGTLKRFHRDVSEVVDATAVADQMRIIDTLSTTDATVTVVDVRRIDVADAACLARYRLSRRSQKASYCSSPTRRRSQRKLTPSCAGA